MSGCADLKTEDLRMIDYIWQVKGAAAELEELRDGCVDLIAAISCLKRGGPAALAGFFEALEDVKVMICQVERYYDRYQVFETMRGDARAKALAKVEKVYRELGGML